jgi:hypothetical protein
MMGSYGINPWLQPNRAPQTFGWRVGRFADIYAHTGPPTDPWELQWGSFPGNFGGPEDQVLVLDAWDDAGGQYGGHYSTIRIDARHLQGRKTNVAYVDLHADMRDMTGDMPRFMQFGSGTGLILGTDCFRHWFNKRSDW